jgi:hypothetical protein
MSEESVVDETIWGPPLWLMEEADSAGTATDTHLVHISDVQSSTLAAAVATDADCEEDSGSSTSDDSDSDSDSDDNSDAERSEGDTAAGSASKPNDPWEDYYTFVVSASLCSNLFFAAMHSLQLLSRCQVHCTASTSTSNLLPIPTRALLLAILQ